MTPEQFKVLFRYPQSLIVTTGIQASILLALAWEYLL
jgi:hypothetical protein